MAELADSLHKQGKILPSAWTRRNRWPRTAGKPAPMTGRPWASQGCRGHSGYRISVGLGPGWPDGSPVALDVSQVQRSSCRWPCPVYGYDIVGETITRIPYNQGLAEAAQLAVAMAVTRSAEAGTQLVCSATK